MIVRGHRQLQEHFDNLGPGDVVIGQVGGKYLREAMLIDLMQRGVTCLPAPPAQILNRSKVAQARVLRAWMPPATRIIARRTDLLNAVSEYQRQKIDAAVTKHDHRHCGAGVLRWESLELLYNQVSLLDTAYPFVLQPFMQDFQDVRVLIVGNYHEAYKRCNPHSFRHNLAQGGQSKPFALDDKTLALCRAVMQRGRFPYAHLDLMHFENGSCYLSEIALNGGIKGSRIQRKALDQKKKALLEALAGGRETSK